MSVFVFISSSLSFFSYLFSVSALIFLFPLENAETEIKKDITVCKLFPFSPFLGFTD